MLIDVDSPLLSTEPVWGWESGRYVKIKLGLIDANSSGASFENSQFLIFAFCTALQHVQIWICYGSAYSKCTFNLTSPFLK